MTVITLKRSPKMRIVREEEMRQGPSSTFVRLTRNPALIAPTRFEPTVKHDGDVVI